MDVKALAAALFSRDIPRFNGTGFMQILCALPVLALGYSWGNRLLFLTVLLLNGIGAFKLAGSLCRDRASVLFGGMLLLLNPASLKALSALDYGAAFMLPVFLALSYWIAYLYGKSGRHFYCFLFFWLLCCLCCAEYALSAALYAILIFCLLRRDDPAASASFLSVRLWPAAAGSVFIAAGLYSPLGAELIAFKAAYIYIGWLLALFFISLRFGRAEISLFSRHILIASVLLIPLTLLKSGAAAAAALGFILPALALIGTDIFSYWMDRKAYGSVFLSVCALGVTVFYLCLFDLAPLFGFNSEIAPFYGLLKEAGQKRGIAAAELPLCSKPIYYFAQLRHGCRLLDLSESEDFSHMAYVLSHLDRGDLQSDSRYLKLAEDPELLKRELRAMKAKGFTYIILHERAYNIINPKKGSLLYDKGFSVLCGLFGRAAAEDYEPVSLWRWGRADNDAQPLRWYRMSVFYLK